jgi:hypothetical protein
MFGIWDSCWLKLAGLVSEMADPERADVCDGCSMRRLVSEFAIGCFGWYLSLARVYVGWCQRQLIWLVSEMTVL